MIIDQLFTSPIFEAADPNRLIVSVRIEPMSTGGEPIDKEVDLTGQFQGSMGSQMNQALDYMKKMLESKGLYFTTLKASYQGRILNMQNRGAMSPQSDEEREMDAMANQIRAKRQATTPAVKEVAPPGAKAERMVKHIKAGYAKDGKLAPKEKGIAFATAWKAHNAGRVEEAADPKRDKAERMIWKYFGQIYDYGDDDGLNYLDEQGDLWNQLMDKYNGEIDDMVAQEPIEVLMQAAQELKVIADEMKFDLDEAGVTEGEYDSRKPFGVRYKVFAGREGRMTTREYWTSSEEKLQRAVDKIQALDNFYEIDGYSYSKEPQGVTENAEDLHIGDPVIITGNGIKFEGATGEIVDFGQQHRFVVVDLYNHGRHSFHSSDVSFNEYAGSDDEEARMYDAGEFGDDYRDEMDGYSYPKESQGVAEGKIQYGVLDNDNVNLIIDKSESKPDGIYSFRGILFKVKGGKVTHYATDGKILQAMGRFNTQIGSYDSSSQAKSILKGIKEGVAEGSSYNIDQDDHDEFTPDEIVRIKNSHFPNTLRDNLRAAKKEARRAKHFSSSSDGGDSKLGSPVGSASDNTYEGVAEGSESAIQKIEKKIQAKRDALGLAREQRRARGQHQQGQQEIKIQAEIDRLSNELTQLKKQGVAEGYQFKGGFPFDVDHMSGSRGINLPSAPTKKFFTDKKQWQRAVDDINSSKYDDNSDYIGVTGRSTVEINGHEWARWSDAQQKGYIKLSSMSEQGVTEGKWFKTTYGWAGGSKPGGGTYKHPDQIKADREAKKKAKEQEQQKNKQPDVGVAEAEKKQVKDRKTGQWYDPDEKFKELQKNPDYIAQMKRMGREEGKGWPKRKEQGVAEGLSDPTRKVFFKVIKTQGTGMPSGYRRVKTMRPLDDGGFYIGLSTPGYGMDYTRHNYKNFSLKDDQGKPITGQEANNIINGKQGVAEGSEQKPAITYKDYTLQYDYQTEDDDPEGYSTATTYYFDVLKDGDRVGEAEYFDYFGNLTIRINGKTKEFGFRHPLASQISQLVSSLPDEQKKDLSDPRFESQDLTEVFADQGSGSTDRDNADYMKRRNAAKKKGYTGRETKAGTWRVFKDGNAVAVAGPFKSADEAAAWIKKHKQGITEMDKSEPSAGRDGPPRPGPDREAKPISAKKATRDAGRMLNRAFKDFKDSHKKKDVTESDTLMLKLQRAMVQEGRVKELADDLKTMPDADFMKKYGKVKAAIRRDMSRIDEKLSTSDTLSRPAASASLSGKAIDDPDIMGSLKSASTPKFDRFSKTDSEPKIDFRAGLVGGEPEVEAEPRLMVDPLPDMQKWGGKFATGSAGGDNRFTAPAGWRYVEKDEDPARYGSAPAAAAAGGGLPDLKYDPQSRTLKSANAPALDMSPKSKFKFDRAAQSQVPVDGSGANPNIDNATRDRARAYAARQNAPVDAAKKKADWKTIYALNKATIGTNPNLIRPGMKLKMPDGSTYPVQPGDNLSKIAAKQSQINELSTNKLAQYKTAAAKDAKEADKVGDFKRGDKRFGGIVQATKKQFDNDAKKVDENRAARRVLMARIVNSR